MGQRYPNDAIHWYLNDLTSDIIAKSGRPLDRYHLGKIIFEGMRRYPDNIHQIDGSSDESETNASVLERSVQCATSMKNLGLEMGDVIILMAPNHLDVCIPYYACLYTGIISYAVDRNLGIYELQHSFRISQPKIIFCQSEKAPDVQLALNEIDHNANIVTFDNGDYLCSFKDFLNKYSSDTDVDDFECTEFDSDEVVAFLIATSGTTGPPKAAAVTQKGMFITSRYVWARFREFPKPTKMAFVASPLQWVTAIISFTISPIFSYPRLQTSANLTLDAYAELINKYRFTWTFLNPNMVTSLLKQSDVYPCDMTCLEILFLGGSAIPEDLSDKIKEVSPNTEIFNIYGMSELTGMAFSVGDTKPASCGKPLGCWQYKIIDVETNDEITEPNTPGELCIKGPALFKEYYNNPEATAEAFIDGWFRTGDLFYKTEEHHFYFVDRIKMLLKYKSNQISPVEIESLIRTHPGVLDVVVTGLPDPECGDLPVAVIVPKGGIDIDPEEIQQLIRDTLSDSKQLRGGIVFVAELPMTPSAKVNRRRIKEMIMAMERL